MRKTTIAALVTAVVSLAAATGAGAATAPSTSYQVSGIATFAPQGISVTGFATGSAGDHGLWRASFATDPLAGCSTVGSSCMVTGGTLGLSSNSQMNGKVTSGSVTLTAQSPGCGRQQLTVDAFADTGLGYVEVIVAVTQIRLSLGGTCVALAGTATGSAVKSVPAA
jgi:hypothetical protein